jgi:hypothetical protein
MILRRRHNAILRYKFEVAALCQIGAKNHWRLASPVGERFAMQTSKCKNSSKDKFGVMIETRPQAPDGCSYTFKAIYNMQFRYVQNKCYRGAIMYFLRFKFFVNASLNP